MHDLTVVSRAQNRAEWLRGASQYDILRWAAARASNPPFRQLLETCAGHLLLTPAELAELHHWPLDIANILRGLAQDYAEVVRANPERLMRPKPGESTRGR